MLLVQHIWDKTCLAPNENHSFPAEKNHSRKSSRKLIVIWKLTTEIEAGRDSLVKTVFRGIKGVFFNTFQPGMPSNAAPVSSWETYSSILTSQKHQIYTKHYGIFVQTELNIGNAAFLVSFCQGCPRPTSISPVHLTVYYLRCLFSSCYLYISDILVNLYAFNIIN